MTACLQSCLERFDCAEDILSRARRKQLGTVTHVFSHINMTLLVEHVLFQVKSHTNQAMLTSTRHFFLAMLCPVILCLHGLSVRSFWPDLAKGKSADCASWAKTALLRIMQTVDSQHCCLFNAGRQSYCQYAASGPTGNTLQPCSCSLQIDLLARLP